MKFGLQVGLDMDKLKGWERQFRDDATRCWLEVMGYWINIGGTQNYPVKWEGLHQLLKDVEYGMVARDLKKALVLSMHHSS